MLEISSQLQTGLTVASSAAVLVAAVTYLVSHKRTGTQARIQQLDASVRTVATEQLQGALHALSRRFINEVVGALNMPSNVMAGDHDAVEQQFVQRDGLASKLLDQFSEAKDALGAFMNEVHAYKYQLFPLLDTLSDGRKEITEFRRQLDELMDTCNDIGRSGAPLARELEEVLRFCAKHPYASLQDDEHERFGRLVSNIMFDRDYAYWVNSFIADEDEAIYWGEDSPARDAVRARAVNNFAAHAYEQPNRLRAQVFRRVYLRYQHGRITCKKFLVMLAAISHTLLCREGTPGADETPSQTAARYGSEAYFALDDEVR